MSLATDGHTARGEAGLADCAKAHLGLDLDKLGKDSAGHTVRRSFGQFLYQPIASIPAEYLRYAARDPLATWYVFWALNEQAKHVLRGAHQAFGFVDDAWLRSVIEWFGPLTHHIQLRASIVTDEITRNGIMIDADRVAAKSAEVESIINECLEALDARGYRPGEKGNSHVLQEALESVAQMHNEITLARTASGDRWSTTKEHLASVILLDPLFESYLKYRHAQKLQKTYLSKMHTSRVHPRFGYLVATGRTYCGGGLNLQNLPKEDDELKSDSASPTIRSAFVPAPGNVFIDADLSQIELVVLAYIWTHQLRCGNSLHTLVNSGQDVHRLIAGAVLNKPADQVTKAERNSAKPVSFGRPGGMGAPTLQQIARVNYDLDLSLEDVEGRIAAYHRLCPELDSFLDDEVDSAIILAESLNLTPGELAQAKGDFTRMSSIEDQYPKIWLGYMLLRTLAEPNPVTQQGDGRPYSAEELDYFWAKAQQLDDELPTKLVQVLRARQPSEELSRQVRNLFGRRPVITVTGRLRANASFCASRNTLFQGAAADGAILGLWRIWRAGFKIVGFIHDQVVVESAADEHVPERISKIERHMIDGILDIVPGMTVRVETSVTRSLCKSDLDPRYCR